MKVVIWFVGKTKDPWIVDATDHYLNRCSRYCTLSVEIVPESRFKKPEEIRKDETERLNAKLAKSQKAITVLLDEHGKQLSSVQFSELVARYQDTGAHLIRFIIGGAFGVEPVFRTAVDHVMSLSTMTFPHQLVRIIFLEQLYRAFTILRGEGYHHE